MGPYGNPAHTPVGNLVVLNDDEIAPYTGFPLQPTDTCPTGIWMLAQSSFLTLTFCPAPLTEPGTVGRR